MDEDDNEEPPTKSAKLDLLSADKPTRKSHRIVNVASVMPKLCVVCGLGQNTKRTGSRGKRVYDKLVTTEQIDAGESQRLYPCSYHD